MLLGGSNSGDGAAHRSVALESSTEPVGGDVLITARFKEW
jgi:hypothetical protein